MLTQAMATPLWKYRIKKLLFLCTQQICEQNLPQSIPFRMLETFTGETQLRRYIDDPVTVREFLEDIYAYLVRRRYFKLVRQMLDEKVPPLDGPVVHPPNSISATLLQMLMHPLKLVNSCTGCSQLILASFIEEILVPKFSEPIRSFVLPCLARDLQFPFLYFIQYLGRTIYNNHGGGGSGSGSLGGCSRAEQMETDDISSTAATALAKATSSKDVFYSSPYLLNALLTLDELYLCRMNEEEYLSAYIRIIASMLTCLNRLPRRAVRQGAALLKSEDSSDSADSDDDERVMRSSAKGGGFDGDSSARMEQECLLEVVERLNDMTRARLIVDNIELHFLGVPEVLHCLCKICHHLMLYNRAAIFEYK